MPYDRADLDWIEAEWAYHLHGRTAFLSREDFLQAQAWAEAGVAAEQVISAMEAYFERRAKRSKAKAFVALSHLEKDVQKAVKLRASLNRAGVEAPGVEAEGWPEVAEPLRSDGRARAAYEAWWRLKATAPGPDSPGFLDHFDAERKAFRELLELAEGALGPQAEALREELRQRLLEAKMVEGGVLWQRAWAHHWAQRVCERWKIPL